MTVLLVDDQEKILEATEKLVNWGGLGVDIVYTANSAAAAKKILSEKPVDIMLTDIEMPQEDGISLQKWVLENFPYVYCIFLTSHADFSYAQEALKNRAFDYIIQPASIPDIEEAIRKCIRALKVRADILRKSDGYDELTVQAEIQEDRKPDSARWGKWMIRGDYTLVRNQIVNLLRLAERDGYLSTGYRQQIIHGILEALSVACYEKKKDLSELFSDTFTHEEMLHSYHSDTELLKAVDDCIHALTSDKSNAQEDSAMTAEERVREVIRYLEDNMDRMVSRREAAQYVFLNEDYFSRVFRKETGLGYKEYVLKTKMDYAEKLLANTSIPVTLVASKVGYENFTNFSQMFKKITGMAPSDYRKKAANEK
ncbi:MAG: response regulator [Blautia sp.]|nr:response regulator [Blautia sp.]